MMLSKIRVKGLIPEDFTIYKKPSLFIATCFCDWKCCHEANIPESVCQNNELARADIQEVSIDKLINYYLYNPITKAVVFGGLEPFQQCEEMLLFIDEFRKVTDDDIVIYTGYNKEEILDEVSKLSQYSNIIIKYGRFIPNHKPHFDEVLGISLISDNQYAERIS